MNNYGKQIKWSTTAITNPTGGICDNFRYSDRYAQDKHGDGGGNHAATILHDAMASLSWSTKLTADAVVPILGDTGGCKIAVTGRTGGDILLSEVVESWGLKTPRTLRCSAGHYYDLPSGGSDVAATDGAVDDIGAAIICKPADALAWGADGVTSALGIIQRFTITQRLKLNPYSEKGKIVGVTACYYERLFALQVLALSDAVVPTKGEALALTDAPDRFKATTNFITDAEETYRDEDGALFDVSAYWSPAQDA